MYNLNFWIQLSLIMLIIIPKYKLITFNVINLIVIATYKCSNYIWTLLLILIFNIIGMCSFMQLTALVERFSFFKKNWHVL